MVHSIFEIKNMNLQVIDFGFRIKTWHICWFIIILAIIDSVKSGSLLRPTIEAGECNAEIGQLMKRCWHEDQNERPDFTDIRQVMRRINK